MVRLQPFDLVNQVPYLLTDAAVTLVDNFNERVDAIPLRVASEVNKPESTGPQVFDEGHLTRLIVAPVVHPETNCGKIPRNRPAAFLTISKTHP